MIISKAQIETLKLNKRQQQIVNLNLLRKSTLNLAHWDAIAELDRIKLEQLKKLIQVELGEIEVEEFMKCI